MPPPLLDAPSLHAACSLSCFLRFPPGADGLVGLVPEETAVLSSMFFWFLCSTSQVFPCHGNSDCELGGSGFSPEPAPPYRDRLRNPASPRQPKPGVEWSALALVV